MEESPDNLPDKLHELLDLAIKDLKKCERSDDYDINMAVWYKANGKCSVCMAGSVLAQTVGLGPDTTEEFKSYFFNNHEKINAIDDLRVGNILDAYQSLHEEIAEGNKREKLLNLQQEFETCSYMHNRDKFFESMDTLRNLLIEHGY